MAKPLKSLLRLADLDQSRILEFFKSVQSTQKSGIKNIFSQSKVASLLFFEPSTRTRFSFETACVRLGIHPLVLAGAQSTSLEKGETLEDCVLNMAALEPDFFIIRSPQSFDLLGLAQNVQIPIINAGWGVDSHPTQALLDFYTLYVEGLLKPGLKIVYVGDTEHSRVVKSHLQLAKIFNIEIAFCGPQTVTLKNYASSQRFENINQALAWADAIYLLRLQKERFSEGQTSIDMSQFCLSKKLQTQLSSQQYILHPGPVNYGVEIDEAMARHENSLILKQVNNGLFVRQQLMANLLTQGECL